MSSMRELALPAIQKLTAEEACIHAAALGAVLADCVAGGASVNFMSPFSLAEGEAFYRKVAGNVASRETVLLAAFLADRIVGTVQVHFVWMPNQPHRAEIAKMLVHRAARRRGIGAALMRAAEAEIVKAGRWLAVLDTATGGDAERLYRKLGWQECGVIPDYALWPEGGLCDATVLYKRLGS
jgi:ribosomal protein S18 acetylase RimI-like enzyme